ncbi:MAG: hypothetical protein AAF891_02550 [Pseudomonadota bacterium]
MAFRQIAMIARLSAALGMCLAMAACSGTPGNGGFSGTGANSGTTTAARFAFFGFPTQEEANANGVISGIPAAATVVVRDASDAQDGYSYAATTINDGSAVASSGASSGQAAFIAISSILPTTDVGTVPASGTATFNGTYKLTYARVPSDLSAPTTSDIEQASGSIRLDADFNTGGVVATTSAASGETLALQSNIGLVQGTSTLLMSATYRGVPGLANGKIGSGGAVAALGGGSLGGPSTSGVFAGGFIAK